MIKEIIIEIDDVEKTMDLNEYYQMYLNSNPLHTIKEVK